MIDPEYSEFEKGERHALMEVRSFIAKHGVKEVGDYTARNACTILRWDARPKPNLGHSISTGTKR